jgi:hypothetical protein
MNGKCTSRTAADKENGHRNAQKAEKSFVNLVPFCSYNAASCE